MLISAFSKQENLSTKIATMHPSHIGQGCSAYSFFFYVSSVLISYLDGDKNGAGDNDDAAEIDDGGDGDDDDDDDDVEKFCWVRGD